MKITKIILYTRNIDGRKPWIESYDSTNVWFKFASTHKQIIDSAKDMIDEHNRIVSRGSVGRMKELITVEVAEKQTIWSGVYTTKDL